MNNLNSREFALFVRRRKQTVFAVGAVKLVGFVGAVVFVLWGLTC